MGDVDSTDGILEGTDLTDVILEGVDVAYNLLKDAYEIDFAYDCRFDLWTLELTRMEYLNPFGRIQWKDLLQIEL